MTRAVSKEYIQRHEAFLKHLIQTTSIPAPPIQAALEYTLLSGGKRIRPLLVYLSGTLLDLPLDILDYIAAAIEMTHCYSLIHDDLPAMDNDDFRRGKPSCHKAFDEATAILAGDGLQALALEILIRGLPAFLEASHILAIMESLLQASGVSGMVSGQSLDLSELSKNTISEEELKNIHSLKTGKLIAACCTMTLKAHNNPSKAEARALKTYAQHLGLVFQMQDDYLDCYATHVLGKERASDLANQKTTFATLLSREALEGEIELHYRVALDALGIFQDRASGLIGLTEGLKARTVF